MGLDNFAKRALGEDLTEEDRAAFKAAAPNLCGGWAGEEPWDLRGKVYAVLVEEVTGESLYDDFLAPDTVKAMYEALRDCEPGEVVSYNPGFGDPEAQIRELRKFFKVCAERNLGIASWW